MKSTMEWTWSCTTSKPEDSHNPMLDEQTNLLHTRRMPLMCRRKPPWLDGTTKRETEWYLHRRNSNMTLILVLAHPFCPQIIWKTCCCCCTIFLFWYFGIKADVDLPTRLSAHCCFLIQGETVIFSCSFSKWMLIILMLPPVNLKTYTGDFTVRKGFCTSASGTVHVTFPVLVF